MKDLISINPGATKEVDSLGCLPLHLSLHAGKSWFTGGVKEIFQSAPEAILVRDGNKMHPLMIAIERCDLSTVYKLFRKSPDFFVSK